MTSRIKATLSWPLLHDGTLEGLRSANQEQVRPLQAELEIFLFVFMEESKSAETITSFKNKHLTTPHSKPMHLVVT